MTSSSSTTVVLSILAVTLVVSVLGAVAVSPWLGVAVPGILLGVAAVIRAVRGESAPTSDEDHRSTR